MTKQKCAHLYEDLNKCQSKKLHASSIYCKKHFFDLDVVNVESKIQSVRLERLRKTIKQIKNGVGFSLE